MKAFKIILFIAIAAGIIAAGIWYNKKLDRQTAAEQAQEQAAAQAVFDKTMSNFVKRDVVAGTGEEAKSGDTVTVNYVGTLDNGEKFDSSYDRKEPYTFDLGKGIVVQGWDVGIVGMKMGGKRELTIPPELGYGARANGPIPANSTLHFTVELLKVSHPTSAPR